MGRGSSGRTSPGNEAYARANLETLQEHRSIVERLNDSRYGVGTYDTSTLRQVEYPNGYQVTFWQIGDNYSPQQYAERVNEFLRLSSDGRTLAGKFEGSPEISFHFLKKTALLQSLTYTYGKLSAARYHSGERKGFWFRLYPLIFQEKTFKWITSMR